MARVRHLSPHTHPERSMRRPAALAGEDISLPQTTANGLRKFQGFLEQSEQVNDRRVGWKGVAQFYRT